MNNNEVKSIVSGALVLADGSLFEGEYIGKKPSGAKPDGSPHSGEIVFNTALTGYQEVLSDPSYAGQIVTFTYPHIGNYGTNAVDNEAQTTHVRGVIVRELARRSSNWRSEQSIEAFLAAHNLGAIAGVDTRRLTRILRSSGAMGAAFGPTSGDGAFTTDELKQAAVEEKGTDGVDLVAQVTTKEPYVVGSGEKNVVAVDFGVKSSILDQLARFATVTVVPASTTAEEILGMSPDGVFLSNGPGDPRIVTYGVDTVAALLGKVPMFGICLGHQILSLAIGGDITKLSFGHHGANHPVQNQFTNKVEITSQNHNFALDPASVQDVADVSHINLNDNVCQGIRLKDGSAFSVQHHPEASPGPHDSAYLFEEFNTMMESK